MVGKEDLEVLGQGRVLLQAEVSVEAGGVEAQVGRLAETCLEGRCYGLTDC